RGGVQRGGAQGGAVDDGRRVGPGDVRPARVVGQVEGGGGAAAPRGAGRHLEGAGRPVGQQPRRRGQPAGVAHHRGAAGERAPGAGGGGGEGDGDALDEVAGGGAGGGSQGGGGGGVDGGRLVVAG